MATSRLLAFTPTFDDALRPETVASVVRQRWDGEMVWEVGRRNSFPPPDIRNVFEQFRRARERTLAGGYDALLTVEHDMVLPPDAVERLWAVDADVVYGVYLLRHGSNVVNALEASQGRNIGMSLTFAPRLLAKAQRADVVEVSGVGFGCTLMRRAVLEHIPFRPDGEDGQAPDIPFATDCLRAGVRQMAHFGVQCGHVEEGKVLQVAQEINERVRVTALQTVTVTGPQRLEAGQTYMLEPTLAGELARAGYVRVLVADPPGPTVEQATDAGADGREMAVGVAERRRRKA